MEKFLHRGSVERVLHRGSIEDSADVLLGIEHHNDSYTQEVWKGSHTVEVQKIVLIRCWVSGTIMNRTPWKPIDVRTTWKCGKGPTPWSRRRLCLSVVVFRAPY